MPQVLLRKSTQALRGLGLRLEMYKQLQARDQSHITELETAISQLSAGQSVTLDPVQFVDGAGGVNGAGSAPAVFRQRNFSGLIKPARSC